MSRSNNHTSSGLVGGYLLSVILVPIYVQMFPVWKILSTRLDPDLLYALPIAITLAALGAILLIFVKLRTTNTRALEGRALLAGILLCLVALALPDPLFPAKRIHVAEYLLLSLVVRYAMSHRMQGLALLVFSGSFTAILGIHDELLQGLHHSRTYGLTDMSVNAVAAFGGAMIWHGLDCFNWKSGDLTQAPEPDRETIFYLVWLLASILALVWPLEFYRGSSIPFWPALPIVGSCVFFLASIKHFCPPWKHGVTALSLVTFPLMLYPAIGALSTLNFY